MDEGKTPLEKMMGSVAPDREFKVNVINNYYMVNEESDHGMNAVFGQMMAMQMLMSAFQPAPIDQQMQKQIEGTISEGQKAELDSIIDTIGVGAVPEKKIDNIKRIILPEETQEAEYEIIDDRADQMQKIIGEAAQKLVTVRETTFQTDFEGKKYFESIELKYDCDWKDVVRTRGLWQKFQVPFLIITLIKQDSKYTTLYSCKPRFAKILVSPRRNVRSTLIPVNGFQHPYFIAALNETRKLNGDKPFYYIEELDTDGLAEEELILGGDNPRSEVYPIQSIFPFKPAKVYSNILPFSFMVDLKTVEGADQEEFAYKITYGKI